MTPREHRISVLETMRDSDTLAGSLARQMIARFDVMTDSEYDEMIERESELAEHRRHT